MNQRQSFFYSLNEGNTFQQQMLEYFKREQFFFYLDSNATVNQHADHDVIIAVGCIEKIECNVGNAFDNLEVFQAQHQDWMFGFMSYDLKNELEDLKSSHKDHVNFPDLCFVIPQHVFKVSRNAVEVLTFDSHSSIEVLIDEVQNQFVNESANSQTQCVTKIIAGDSKEDYLEKATIFLQHIKRGDIYEANFCTQFTATDLIFNSLQAFKELNAISEPPFAAYVRCDAYQVVSASPERYLKKKGSLLTSQPIKGTARRSSDPIEDKMLKEHLFKDAKERSENVMIVDLVRNDLSKTATKGSVNVEELYGIYTFKQVHHMISTITAQLSKELSAIDAIKTTFPMGSMTGAPKVSAMKIIEHAENFKRGLYSGSIGYFDPQGDFDFNVVIRTILYNKNSQHLSLAVGSAITIAAQPEKEYEECQLKARALFEVLARQGICFE
jgi:para-aminobenzoate synthetase component 1